jgi:hypothetical protein
MTRNDRALIRYAKKVNRQIPRNGSGKMDDLAFSKLAEKLRLRNETVLKRLAEDR